MRHTWDESRQAPLSTQREPLLVCSFFLTKNRNDQRDKNRIPSVQNSRKKRNHKTTEEKHTQKDKLV